MDVQLPALRADRISQEVRSRLISATNSSSKQAKNPRNMMVQHYSEANRTHESAAGGSSKNLHSGSNPISHSRKQISNISLAGTSSKSRRSLEGPCASANQNLAAGDRLRSKMI